MDRFKYYIHIYQTKMKKIKCTNCQSEEKWKYGHFRGKQRYICKKCRRTFTAGSSRDFPPTNIPFEFIAFMLYMIDRHSFKRNVTNITNFYLNIITFEKPEEIKKISRSTIYLWRKNYGNTYTKLISEKETKDFFYRHQKPEATKHLSLLVRTFFPSKKKLKTKKMKKKRKKTPKERRKTKITKYLEEILESTSVKKHTEVLAWFVETLGKDETMEFFRWAEDFIKSSEVANKQTTKK